MRHFCPAEKYHDVVLQIKLPKSAATKKKTSLFCQFFFFQAPFTSFKRTAGWLQDRMGNRSGQISGLPRPAVSPHPACYCYCSYLLQPTLLVHTTGC